MQILQSEYNVDVLRARIKEARGICGITQKDLLSKCGLGINYIIQLSNNHGASCSDLLKIANVLNCSVDYLLGRTDIENLTDNEAELISLFKKLNYDNQIRIIERIRVMIDTQNGI